MISIEEFKSVQSSFKNDDITLLLQNLEGKVPMLTVEESEDNVQNGGHYSTTLVEENVPDSEYYQAAKDLLGYYSIHMADYVAGLGDELYIDYSDKKLVLVSLARAGLPVGILLKRYLKKVYNFDVDHYGVSIILGKGLDKKAMRLIADQHSADNIVYVDGWVGQGRIYSELERSHKELFGVLPRFLSIIDPVGVCNYSSTFDDTLIPNACLNSLVSGLISRTVYTNDSEFHGAVYYDFDDYDLTNEFLDSVTFYFNDMVSHTKRVHRNLSDAEYISEKYSVERSRIKLGINETLRVLIRRVPEMVIIDKRREHDYDLTPVHLLCNQKGIKCCYDYLHNYSVGVIIADKTRVQGTQQLECFC